MTTVTAATTRTAIAGEAAGVARALRAKFGGAQGFVLVDGSADLTAAPDALALATVLETAAGSAATGTSGPTGSHRDHWPTSSVPYTLSWSTSGANDATTKAQLTAWLQGGTRTGGMAHGTVAGSMCPKLGSALTTLLAGL